MKRERSNLNNNRDTDDAFSRMMEEYYLDWKIHRNGSGTLNTEQLQLHYFGAPLLFYNDENVDTIDYKIDTPSEHN